MQLITDKSIETCIKTAKKLINPKFVKDVSTAKENVFFNNRFLPWEPTTLAYGYPAIIVLLQEIDHFSPDVLWKDALQKYINLLIDEIKKNGVLNSSLFAGLSGVCFAIHLAKNNFPEYLELHRSLHNLLLGRLEEQYMKPIDAASKRGEYLQPLQYGIISGLNGVLSYLLLYRFDSKTRDLTVRMLKYIEQLTQPILLGKHEIPGWYTSADYLVLKDGVLMYPKGSLENHLSTYSNGCFDTGNIHGISGCLSILAKAILSGFTVDKDSLHRIIQWLRETQQDIGSVKRVWPKRFAFNPEKINKVELRSGEYIDSWSYGAPGILNSILLASIALNDDNLYSYSVSELIEASKRLSREPSCTSFFYGQSGNLTIMHQLYLATGIDAFSQKACEITKMILDQYDDEIPFGFKCSPPTDNLRDSYTINNCGLMTGVTGIALSLLFSTSKSHRPWTQIFLLN